MIFIIYFFNFVVVIGFVSILNTYCTLTINPHQFAETHLPASALPIAYVTDTA